MSQGKNSREIIFVSQFSRSYPHRGGNFERGKMPSLVGERQSWRHFRRQFGRGSLRVKNCRKTVGSQFLPRDIKVSRRALWARGRRDPPVLKIVWRANTLRRSDAPRRVLRSADFLGKRSRKTVWIVKLRRWQNTASHPVLFFAWQSPRGPGD